MSNLIRERLDYLMPVVDQTTFGIYEDKAGLNHLVIKSLGIDIPAFTGQTAVVKTASAGTKQVTTLTPSFIWNGETEKDFSVEVIKKAMNDGFTNRQFDIAHTYTFRLKGFHTSTVGTTVDATDAAAIVTGLKAAIAADVQLNASAVNTGASIVGSGSVTLILTAKDFGTMFKVRTFDDQFTQALTTAYTKPTLTNDDVARIFSIQPSDAGRRVNIPSVGTTYACITITQLTKGYDNVVAGGVNNVREQVINLYMPAAALTANKFIALDTTATLATRNGLNMADSGGSVKNIKDWIKNVIPVIVNEVAY